LNVRSGAGTDFSTLAQLPSGATVALLGGPIAANGYDWYQVQFDFVEWPSAVYPRTGWVAAGDGSTAFLVPAKPPNTITIASTATGFYGSAGLAPSVGSKYPAPGATATSAGVTPVVTFDRAVSGVNSSSFVLRRPNGTVVAATLTNAGDSTQFSLDPTWALESGMTFTLSLTSAIRSVEGGSLTPVSWSFTVKGTLAPPPVTGTYNPPARLIIKLGTHTGYQFNSSGLMTAQKSYTLGSNSSTYTSARKALTNQSGTWFYVTSGVWAGYWLRASGLVYLESAPIAATSAPNATFNPAARLAFKLGTHTGYQFNSSGQLTALKSYTLASNSAAYTSSRKAIANQSGTWYYVTSGVWAGYWVRASDVVYLP